MMSAKNRKQVEPKQNLTEYGLQQEMQAIKELTQIRQHIQELHGVVYQGDLLLEIRTERERDFERVWRCE